MNHILIEKISRINTNFDYETITLSLDFVMNLVKKDRLEKYKYFKEDKFKLDEDKGPHSFMF